MSRQLENLKRLFSKLQTRYGAGDALVSQFKQEVEFREKVESDFQQLTAASVRGSPGQTAQRRRDVARPQRNVA